MIKLLQNNYIKIFLLILLFFILAIFLLDMPLTKLNYQLADHNDIKLVNYIWSWEWHALKTEPLNIFNANFYAPHKYSLALTENLFGSFLLAWPIILISKNIILAYNFTVILSFIVAGLGMYWLIYYLTKNNWAALVGSLIYAFAPYKLIQNISHLNLTGMWLPYIFLYLHKFFTKPSWKHTWLLTLFIILIFLTSFHYFIFLPVVALVFMTTYILTKQFKFNKNNIKKIILTLTAVLLVVIPISYPYFSLKQTTVFFRPLEVVEAQSLDLIDYLIPPFYLKNYYSNRSHLEKYSGLGLTVLIILLFSLIIGIKNKNKRHITHLIAYAILALIGFLFSFGLFIQFFPSSSTGLPGPYILFYTFIPGFDGIRATNRFYVFTLLSIAVICGYGVYYFYKLKLNNKLKKSINILIIFFMLWEFSYVPSIKFKTPVISKDERQLYNWIAHQPLNKIFLELPADNQHNVQYVYNARLHFKKIANGYGGYEPEDYQNLINKTFNFTPDTMFFLFKKYQINYLVYHFGVYKNSQKKFTEIFETTQKNDKIKYVTHFGKNYVYEVIY